MPFNSFFTQGLTTLPNRIYARLDHVEALFENGSLSRTGWLALFDGLDADWFDHTGRILRDRDEFFITVPLVVVEVRNAEIPTYGPLRTLLSSPEAEEGD